MAAFAFAPSQKKRYHSTSPADSSDFYGGYSSTAMSSTHNSTVHGQKRCRRICFEDLLRECYDGSTRHLFKILFEEDEGCLGLWLQLENKDPSAVLRTVNNRLQTVRREESIRHQEELAKKQKQQPKQQHKSKKKQAKGTANPSSGPPPSKPKSIHQASVCNTSNAKASSAPPASSEQPLSVFDTVQKPPSSNAHKPFYFDMSAGFHF